MIDNVLVVFGDVVLGIVNAPSFDYNKIRSAFTLGNQILKPVEKASFL